MHLGETDRGGAHLLAGVAHGFPTRKGSFFRLSYVRAVRRFFSDRNLLFLALHPISFTLHPV